MRPLKLAASIFGHELSNIEIDNSLAKGLSLLHFLDGALAIIHLISIVRLPAKIQAKLRDFPSLHRMFLLFYKVSENVPSSE